MYFATVHFTRGTTSSTGIEYPNVISTNTRFILQMLLWTAVPAPQALIIVFLLTSSSSYPSTESVASYDEDDR